MKKREEIREKTMQILFQMEVMKDYDYRNITFIQENQDVLDEKQALKTLDIIRDHLTEIDDRINQHTERWTTERMGKIELAIMRIATAELCYMDSIPDSVSIDEAVRIAKKYGEDRSYAFVNAVLGKIAKEKDK